jgi:hypothetical protein
VDMLEAAWNGEILSERRAIRIDHHDGIRLRTSNMLLFSGACFLVRACWQAKSRPGFDTDGLPCNIPANSLGRGNAASGCGQPW